MGTALGSGVAVPHAMMDEIATPRLAFARAPSGIDWNAPDGLPVKFIFLLLTPPDNDRAQLQLLQVIGKTMHSAENRDLLLAAPDRDIGPLWVRLLNQ